VEGAVPLVRVVPLTLVSLFRGNGSGTRGGGGGGGSSSVSSESGVNLRVGFFESGATVADPGVSRGGGAGGGGRTSVLATEGANDTLGLLGVTSRSGSCDSMEEINFLVPVDVVVAAAVAAVDFLADDALIAACNSVRDDADNLIV
jgi:hypothetical protein